MDTKLLEIKNHTIYNEASCNCDVGKCRCLRKISYASSHPANPKQISKLCIIGHGVDLGPTWR